MCACVRMHGACVCVCVCARYFSIFKSPNIFHCPDLPNIMLAKFTCYTGAVCFVTAIFK